MEGDLKQRVEEIIKEYGEGACLLPVLKEIWKSLGCVPVEWVKFISQRLNIPLIKIYRLLTFYGEFSLKRKAKFNLKVCDSLSCHLKGSQGILEVLKEELGIEKGEVSSDGKFSLEVVGCLGLCDGSPAMLVNEEKYVNLDKEKVKEIIERLKKEGENGESSS